MVGVSGQIVDVNLKVMVRIQLPKLAVDDIKVFVGEKVCHLKVNVDTDEKQTLNSLSFPISKLHTCICVFMCGKCVCT